MTKSRILISCIFTIACCVACAQSVHRSDDVNSMSGLVNVLPNPRASHTTIVFNSNTPVSPTSNQIVFVLQENNTALPPAWSRRARILTGDGFVAVVPDENQNQKWLLKFSDREIPSSLTNLGFQPFEIIGIARYGEKEPLTAEQIASLSATGRNCGPTAPNKAREFSITDSSISSSRPLFADPVPVCPSACTSGGAGSTQCSAGGSGCSVTCNSGSNACCNANTNNCGCCKIGGE